MSVDTGHLMTTKNTKERQVECALFLNKHHPVLALRSNERVGVGITFFKDAFPDVGLNRL